MDEELSAFNEYARLVERTITLFFKIVWIDRARYVLKHNKPTPLAIAETGAPDYGRRAPHPALLFQVITN